MVGVLLRTNTFTRSSTTGLSFQILRHGCSCAPTLFTCNFVHFTSNFLYYIFLYPGVQSVRIINMRVPEVIQYGTRDRVTLDCDYVTSNVTGLVVKWFYEDKSQPVYQWIPPQKPQALGILKNKVRWYTECLNVIVYNIII